MYEKINDFIVGMVTTHDKGYMLVFTTFVHIYIYFLVGTDRLCTTTVVRSGGGQIIIIIMTVFTLTSV